MTSELRLAKPEPDTQTYVSTHPKHRRLFIELRPERSRYFQARTYLDGKLHQISLKTVHLPTAQRLGEDWYKKKLRGSVSEGNRHPFSKLAVDPTMAELYASYKTELPRSKQAYLEMKWSPIAQFWCTVEVTEVTTPKLKEFVKWRRRHRTKEGKLVKAHTIHKDLIAVRQILKYAIEEGHIPQLPLFPKAGQIERNPRPWLTPAEWSALREVSRLRIQEAATKTVRHCRQELDDEMRWFVASMMRISDVIASDNPPAQGLRFCDCRIVKNAKGDRILVCTVRGKKRAREVVATPTATEIFERRLKVASGTTALIFPIHHREALTELLQDERVRLHVDSTGFKRNFKSLRATSISFAILAGRPRPDLLAIARNAGTSLLMIDAFYAKRLSAEMHLDTLSVELPEEARDFKRIVASVPADETAEHHEWLRGEIDREAAEWPNDAPVAPDHLDWDEEEA